MSILQIIKIAVRYLPEIIDLIKSISEQVENGVQEIEIRKRIKQINAAFILTNRQQTAHDLNDVFRNRK